MQECKQTITPLKQNKMVTKIHDQRLAPDLLQMDQEREDNGTIMLFFVRFALAKKALPRRRNIKSRAHQKSAQACSMHE